ncbi:MAG TPA: cyclase family protein [Candidatus Obscuribacterales bacterium]
MSYTIIDISQPVSSTSACFPGDTPFSRVVSLSLKEGAVVNLTAFTMSPHVGTHTDAPSHVKGDIDGGDHMAAKMSLHPFVGPVAVVDLAPFIGPIGKKEAEKAMSSLPSLPPRVVFKTQSTINYDVFEEDYAYFTEELIAYLSGRGVVLAGIDTPSVDQVQSKTLAVHHELIAQNLSWLENLDLTRVSQGIYFLIALPLKFVELEASPVRAVLLSSTEGSVSLK